eukprot:m.354168 g.354168  ORF g.354168 m.354168 type:complete len:387 (+) comp28001_c0_seq13:120-1280(+)
MATTGPLPSPRKLPNKLFLGRTLPHNFTVYSIAGIPTPVPKKPTGYKGRTGWPPARGKKYRSHRSRHHATTTATATRDLRLALGLFLVGATVTVPFTVSAQICEDTLDGSGGGLAPIIMPPPKMLTPTSYRMRCTADAPGQVYNNAEYADGNGPRGAANASDCCAVCSANDDCNFWSFNVDPALPKTDTCRWGTLTNCCFLHASGINMTSLGPATPSVQFGAKGQWSSGTVAPTVSVALDRRSLDTPPAVRGGPEKVELAISAAKTSIVASSETLVPLARVLANDIFQLSGIQLNASTTAGVGTAGDITLTLIPSETAWHGAAHLAPDAEKYSVTIDGRGAAILCHTYTGCAWGVTTLLQTMCISGVAYQTAAFPSYNLTDWPDVP